MKNKIADHYRKSYKEGTNNSVSNHQFFESDGNWLLNERPKEWNQTYEVQLLDDPNFSKTLQKCLSALPQQWNASIVLKYIDEKDSKIICQELGITTSNYWQILHRAKLQLRKCLEINWFKK